VTDLIRTGSAAVFEGAQIRRENEALLLENATLRNQVTQLEEAGRQYEELKSALKLKDKYDRYEIIGGRLMSREIGDWFDVFRIDIGITDGLIVGQTGIVCSGRCPVPPGWPGPVYRCNLRQNPTRHSRGLFGQRQDRLRQR